MLKLSHTAQKRSQGFSSIEVLVGTAVFLVVSLAAYNAYLGVFKMVTYAQQKTAALNLANEQIEIIRNLPYSRVGVVGSVPAGDVPYTQTLVRGAATFNVITTVRNIDQTFDGTIGGAPNDTSPADNKVVEIRIECPTCERFTPVDLTTHIAPKSLETASTNGALFIRVFDANGQPVSGANVQVINRQGTSTITINDTTGVNGMLQLVDVPPGNSAYEVTVSKSGYSTDRTYTPGAVGNPSPSKPHATVALQQVTQVSFVIDRLSSLAISTLNNACTPIASVPLTLTGDKLIGAGVVKNTHSITTNGSGAYTLSDIEWDAYSFTTPSGSYQIAGVSPLNAVAVNPNTTQNVSVILQAKNTPSMLVSVRDSNTLLPLADAEVTLDGSSYDSTKITGRGSYSQTDWSGGGGQLNLLDETEFYSSDGNIDYSSQGEIKLKSTLGTYASSGTIESSVFDLGSASVFNQLVWTPADQQASIGPNAIMFQIASATSSTATTTWTYRGPDGTAGSYYSVSDTPINAVHTNDRYFRYKLIMNTASTTMTPLISDVSFTATSSCIPPGQVIFSSIPTGTYSLTVSKPGFTDYVTSVVVGAGWSETKVILGP